ncbi:hypothetical protein PENTCL1PPCAC_27520, partial [Pristionchus entomophagus]
QMDRSRARDKDVSIFSDGSITKRRKVTSASTEKSVKKEMEDEEIEIVFSGSKEAGRRNETAEKRLTKALEKIESLKEQLSAGMERETGLARQLEQSQMLSRVKMEQAEELYEKSNELTKMKRMFDGACKEAKMAQLRAEEAEKKLAESAVKQPTSKDTEYIMKNLELGHKISSMTRERDRLKKEIEPARRNEDELIQSRIKLEDINKENEELKKQVRGMEEMKAEIHFIRDQSVVLERKLIDEKESKDSWENMARHAREYAAHLESENVKIDMEKGRLENEMQGLKREMEMMRSTASGRAAIELEQTREQNESLLNDLKNRPPAGDFHELMKSNTHLLREIVEMQNNQRMIEESANVLKAAFDENEKEKERLEAQKRSLKERIVWFEKNWTARNGCSSETEWAAGVAAIKTSDRAEWSELKHIAPPPPPFAFPLHPSPLFVPPGTVFPKPPPTPPHKPKEWAHLLSVSSPTTESVVFVAQNLPPLNYMKPLMEIPIGIGDVLWHPPSPKPQSTPLLTPHSRPSPAMGRVHSDTTRERKESAMGRILEESPKEKKEKPSFVRRLTASDNP